jgi:hypothetical protein
LIVSTAHQHNKEMTVLPFQYIIPTVSAIITYVHVSGKNSFIFSTNFNHKGLTITSKVTRMVKLGPAQKVKNCHSTSKTFIIILKIQYGIKLAIQVLKYMQCKANESYGIIVHLKSTILSNK